MVRLKALDRGGKSKARAIKSTLTLSSSPTIITFQFLNGTIKSILITSSLNDGKIFQFLNGTIKRIDEKRRHLFIRHFNS